jgi:DNA-binding PadR family transcriptional regulator
MAGKLTHGELAFLLLIALQDTWPEDLDGASLANTKRWVSEGWLEIVQETKPGSAGKHDLYIVTDEGMKLLAEALNQAHERFKARQPKKSDRPS